MAFCSNCGAALQPGKKFCTQCGQRLNADALSTVVKSAAARPRGSGKGAKIAVIAAVIAVVAAGVVFVPRLVAQPKAPEGFVYIAPGTFMMGSPETEPDREDIETQHEMKISRGFYMGKYEVTQAEYEAVMGKNPSRFKGDNLPVEQVSWYDAVEYCNARSRKEGLTPAYTIDKSRSDPNNQDKDDAVRWVVTWNRNANGYRLPTEAEWEYACRAGTTTAYSSGSSVDNAGWYDGNSGGKNHPVGQKQANAWGLYDMHGNVLEWCWDWADYYSSGAQTDPAGASSGVKRILRGGSWRYLAQDLRSAYRNADDPDDRYDYGFRVVRPQ